MRTRAQELLTIAKANDVTDLPRDHDATAVVHGADTDVPAVDVTTKHHHLTQHKQTLYGTFKE